MVRDGMGWFNRWGLISYLLVDYGWSVGQKIVVDISNLSYVVSGSLLKHIPNFFQIGQKHRSQKFFVLFGFGRSGWQVEKWSQAFQILSILFLFHFQPTYQISSKSDKKQSEICRFWSVGLVGRKMVVGISNSFHLVFVPFLAPQQISSKSDKNTKLEIFTCGRFRLVGLVGRKMVAGILNSFFRVFAP